MNFIRTAIHRPVTVSMFVVAVVLFGLVSLDRLALNLLPDISYPSLTVQTNYADAAPEEVESLVTRPIEEAVGVIPGVTRLTSVSRPGQSEVVLEFAWKTNMDLASLETREKVDFVSLPRDAERPVILRFDPSHDPILRLRLSGALSLSRLRYAAERELKRQLESAEGVAAIKVIGGLEEQIRVEIDEKRLAEVGVPIAEVTQALTRENLNQASGSLYDQDSSYLVRILNQFRSVEEIGGIIVRQEQGRKILLSDVARVWRGSKDREVIARLNGKESVEMAIYKEGDANTVTVARAVRQRLEALRKANLFPQGVTYEIVFDQAEFIEQAVDDVLWAAILGGALATIILFVFLRDLRSTLTIGFSIPISIMATFGLMYQTGLTLNLMSLGGVALGVGMLVDNSIVVLESVHRYRSSGADLGEAVFRGTREVGMAVTASTLTTVAVFVPLIFVEGIAGQLFKDQALTITYSLLASLLVALTLLPAILAFRVRPPAAEEPVPESGGPAPSDHVLRRKARAAGGFLFHDLPVVVLTDLRRVIRMAGRAILRVLQPALSRFERGYGSVSGTYPRALVWALDHKAAVFGVALLSAAAAGVAALGLGAELIPPMTQGEFVFEVRLPEGSPLARTDELLRRLEGDAAAIASVKTVFSSVGGSNRNQFAREVKEENVGQLYVVMKDKQDKGEESDAIGRIRERLREYPDATYLFSRPTLFTFKTPIEIEIYGYDLERLRAASELVASRLGAIRGLSDIAASTRPGHPEIQVRFERERLARLGLEESQVASILRNKIRGDVASRYREDDKQIEILVRAEESDRNSIDSVRSLVINLGAANGPGEANRPGAVNGTPAVNGAEARPTTLIRLGAVADIGVRQGPAEVRRIRGQRAAVISANVTGRDLKTVSDEIRAELRGLAPRMPAEITTGLGGQNEELATAYRSLLLALGLAVFLVYLVMASQFESFVHPFVILFSVPLAMIGVVFALLATGAPFSVMVFLGVIILAGIVVNNAIVLIDYTNQLREQGMTVREALRTAGEVRLRPILMTTLTTVLGLIPMAIGWGEGAEIRSSMAVTVIGGLTFSTLLTLVFIPVVYELVTRERRAIHSDGHSG